MIGKKTKQLMNEQIKHEVESAYLYWSMEAYFRAQNLDGMATWMRVQTQEELVHAMKFFEHMSDRGVQVELLPLAIHKINWKSPLEAFKDAYKHEQFITAKINNLMKSANDENDHASAALLQWFVNEQVEEEANSSKIAQTLERASDSGSALILIDRELGTRVFTMPGAADPGAAGA
jgi:ferritin